VDGDHFVIFMPIFLPLLGHFGIDPLFFGLLVAVNLQTAFLSPSLLPQIRLWLPEVLYR
jgi:TRAP-type mannitol/chloroaromatic compound transport system permease large subunit